MTGGQTWRRALAEAVGTFGLVFAGTGAIIINTVTDGAVGHIGIAMTFGLIVMTMIYATGHISGAHINPAVTVAFWATRQFPARLVPVYLLAQISGAILASLGLRTMFGNVAALGTTLPREGAGQSLGLEIALTFFLMFVIMAVATDVRAVGQAAAIAIGGTVGLEAMFAGPISGASMNPARSLAPALVSGTWEHQWLYIAGPVLGALAGAMIYALLREDAAPIEAPLESRTRHETRSSAPVRTRRGAPR
jgi:MIP family channel proteins